MVLLVTNFLDSGDLVLWLPFFCEQLLFPYGWLTINLNMLNLGLR